MTAQVLFTPPAADVCQALENLPEVLETVRPLTKAQQRNLPDDIFRLSRLLTTERRELSLPYWSSPAFVSAYCYYFWPWNLVRLVSLLPNLPLPAVPELAEGSGAWLVDMGSGPLTLPVALWLARPDLHAANIRVFAQDSSRQPLTLGQRLFEALGRAMGQNVWQSVVHQGPLEGATRTAVQRMGRKDSLWLLSAANVLNEYCQGRRPCGRGHGPHDADEEEAQSALEMRLSGFLEQLGMALRRFPAAGLLCIEPGTRLGGKIVMQTRALLREQGLRPVLPCPHDGPCPLDGGRSWCHFTFAAQAAPKWLVELSVRAGLGKDALSLAPLFVTGEGKTSSCRERIQARIVSTPFVVPGLRGRARYACTGKGLVLLEGAAELLSGTLTDIAIPADARRDGKSGALIVPAQRTARTVASNGQGARKDAATANARPARQTRPKAKSTRQKQGRSRQGQRKP